MTGRLKLESAELSRSACFLVSQMFMPISSADLKSLYIVLPFYFVNSCLVTLFASSWHDKSASAFESVEMLNVKSVIRRKQFSADSITSLHY